MRTARILLPINNIKQDQAPPLQSERGFGGRNNLKNKYNMGRSVMTLGGAQMTAYIGVGEDFEMDYLIEDLQELGMELGMDKSSRWEDREVRILIDGNGAEVGIAEYGGVVSLGIRTETEDDPSAARWIDKNGPDLVKIFHSYGTPIRSVGTFSNGETIYEKK